MQPVVLEYYVSGKCLRNAFSVEKNNVGLFQVLLCTKETVFSVVFVRVNMRAVDDHVCK